MPLSRLYAGFLDLLYPRRCPVCSEIVMPKGNLICPDCMEKLAFVRRPVCKCCGKEIVSLEAEYCFDCTRHPHSFDSGMALINYNDTASRSMALIPRTQGISGFLFRGHVPALWPGDPPPFS